MLIGVVALAGIVSGATAVSLFSLVAWPAFVRGQKRRRFPVPVPGWGLRLSSRPPFNADVGDVERVLSLVTDRLVEVKGYSRKRVRRLWSRVTCQWVAADNPDAERWIVDEYGRKISGDYARGRIRVVYLPDDRLFQTAFAHELIHAAQEHFEGVSDYGHDDEEFWSDVGDWVAAESRK